MVVADWVKRWVGLGGLAAAALLSAQTAGAAQAPTVIPLEPYAGGHWAFRVEIAGQPQLVAFDTGGGLTAITPAAAAALGCKPWGQLTGFRMRGDRLDLPRCEAVSMRAAGRPIRFQTVGVWDFNHMLPKGVEPIAANVGLDAFPGDVVTLDIAHRRIVLETPASLKARIAHARETPMQAVDEAEGLSHTLMAGLDTPKGRLWLNLDCGDDAEITIGRHAAALLGLDPDRKGSQPFHGVLAGGVPLEGRAQVEDLIFDGNIGAPVLAHWVVTIDLKGHHLWLAPAGSPAVG